MINQLQDVSTRRTLSLIKGCVLLKNRSVTSSHVSFVCIEKSTHYITCTWCACEMLGWGGPWLAPPQPLSITACHIGLTSGSACYVYSLPVPSLYSYHIHLSSYGSSTYNRTYVCTYLTCVANIYQLKHTTDDVTPPNRYATLSCSHVLATVSTIYVWYLL